MGFVSELEMQLLRHQSRLQQEMMTARYPWGFARLAAWLQRQPRSPERLQGSRRGLLFLDAEV